MQRRKFLATAAASAVPLVAGCGGGGGGNEGTPTEEPTPTRTVEPDVTISFEEDGVNPIRTEIESLARVRVENNTDETHFLQSRIIHDEANSWSIGEKLTPDESAQISQGIFEREGAYEFVCAVHGAEEECGVILVGDVDWSDKTLPCEE